MVTYETSTDLDISLIVLEEDWPSKLRKEIVIHIYNNQVFYSFITLIVNAAVRLSN